MIDASLGKIPTTSARRLTSFSIRAPFVNSYDIAPPANGILIWRADQLRLKARVPPEAAFSTSSDKCRLRMGYGQGAGGCFLIRGVYLPQQAWRRAAKENERTHSNPVPEGTLAAPLVARRSDVLSLLMLPPSRGNLRRSSTSGAEQRPACVPERPWLSRARGASQFAQPRI